MDYTVRHIPLDAIHRLSTDWARLWQGADMTYHQSFGWYEMLARFTPINDNIECAYYAVERDGVVVLIAPLWIVKRRFAFANAKGVYLMGRNSFTDYLNLIYDEFDPEALHALVREVTALFGPMPWHFELLKDSSALYHYLTNEQSMSKLAIKSSSAGTCAALQLPPDDQLYQKMLSKNTRQNIRTAINRAARDGVEFVIKADDRDIDPTVCRDCRNAWAERRKRVRGDGLSWRGRIYLGLKYLLHDRFLIKYPEYLPFIDDPNARLLTITDKATGVLAAFFCYGMDYEHHQVLVMTAGVNEDYAKYSPGMVCMRQFVAECISEDKVDNIDFTRGNEGYKYHLGANTHVIYNLCVLFKN